MTLPPTLASGWPVIGHEWAVDQLDRAIRHDRIRHAYLITGPDRIGKTTLAYALAAALNCTGNPVPCGKCRACTLIGKRSHPDITQIEAEHEGGTLKIEQVRDIQQTLSLRPYEARYRIAILRRFHEANPAAANALLKTLEEPAQNVVLILTARSVEGLLPTIVSRCQPLNLRPLPIETTREALEWHWNVPQDVAKTLAQISGGRMGWAIQAYTDPGVLAVRTESFDLLDAILRGNRRERFALVEKLTGKKPELYPLLDLWQGFWRDVLLVASGSHATITNYDYRDMIQALAQNAGQDAAQRALEATRRTITYLRQNANTRLSLEVMVLDYPMAG